MSNPVFHPTLWDATIYSIARKIGFWLGLTTTYFAKYVEKARKTYVFRAFIGRLLGLFGEKLHSALVKTINSLPMIRCECNAQSRPHYRKSS
jgi:hypothetical protein